MNHREAAWHSRHAELLRDGHIMVPAPSTNIAPTLPDRRDIDDIAGRRGRMIRHTEFARELELTPRQVRDVFKRGGLPGALEHSAYVLVIPSRLLRLAKTYGLRQVERMAQAGLLSK